MRRPRVRALLLLVPLSLATAGCGVDDSGSDAAPTTTADTPSTTTSDGGDDTTTTEADQGGDETTTTTIDDGGAELPSTDDLEALLPAAADLGSGWSVDDDDDGNSSDPESDAQFDEACPEAAALSDDDDDPLAVRSFAGADDARVEVELDDAADAPTADELDDYVAALNACSDVSVTTADGSTISFSVQARPYDDYGDVGVQAQIDLTIENPQLPRAVDITSYALFFKRGPVGVAVTGIEGIDPATYEAEDFDTDLLLDLASDVDAGLEDLLG